MCRLKVLIKSIVKQGLKFKLVFFQLVIVFISLNFAFVLINKNRDVKSNINNLVNKDKSIMYRILVGSQNKDSINPINKVYKEISNNKMVDKIGSYEISKSLMDDCEFKAIFLNKDASNLYNMNVSSGSNKIFQYQKVGDEIPIIISNNLSSKLDVGSIVRIKLYQNSRLKNFKVIVIGILNNNAYFWNTRIGDNSSIVSLKDSIIIPFHKDYFYDEALDISMKSRYTVVSIKEEFDLNEFTTYLSNLNSKNIMIDYIKINDFITQIYNINKPWIIITLIFSLLLSILSVIGFIGILISYITFRTKEYGIRFALGSSSRELTRLICGEISLSLLLSP
ncbi:ABC transporter permease [Clostridium rectalis]|uniref:ABC transporter permease n=1 Tax=Clostridium rectalis TaxID=2040295 RepID=UPI0019D26F81|nr:ABC transporter permease [Clostridium rectalis]